MRLRQRIEDIACRHRKPIRPRSRAGHELDDSARVQEALDLAARRRFGRVVELEQVVYLAASSRLDGHGSRIRFRDGGR